MFLFCFVYVIVLYFPNFLYVSFWFFVFYPISLFDFFGCLFLTFIDVSSIPFSLPCSLLRILIFLFVFLPSLILSLFHYHIVFCCFHSRLKSPKNQSICSKKMEEPLNILTIGPEQMNKCSGENTLLALKN